MSQEKLLAMMEAHQIVPPDPSDVEDVRRALLQLKERLVVEYRHVAALGRLPEQADASAPDDAARAFRRKTLASLARPNTRRGRRPRGHRARRNPLNPEEVEQAVRFAGTPDASPDSVEQLRDALVRQRRQAIDQPLTADIVEAMFPREGRIKPDTWAPPRRFQALGRYDLVSRLGDVGPPPPDADPDRPFSDAAALQYIIDSAGLSLREARSLLQYMRESAENKGPGGGDKAMQPSSAMCKASRVQKVRAMKLPADLAAKTAFDSVVILVSPIGSQPRVMTFRHGTHIDCDLVGSDARQVLQLIGRALQVSLYWLAEKPKRLQKTQVYMARLGSPEVYRVWQPGNPISLQQAMANLQAGPTFTYQVGSSDVSNYTEAVVRTFGTSDAAPVSRLRESRTKRPAEPAPDIPDIPEEPVSASWSSPIIDIIEG